jgi:predicted DNA-binding transcriptional regulator AlpA
MTLSIAAALERRYLSTEEFAARMLVLRQTVLKAYSRDGTYCSVRPIRLPNRRLAWPEEAVDKLFDTTLATSSTTGA